MVRSSIRGLVTRVTAGALLVAAVGLGHTVAGQTVAAAAPRDSATQTVVNDNITATKTVSPATAYRGEDVTVRIRLEADGIVDRYLREFTDYAPAGYELRSVSATVWRSGPLLGNWNKGGQYDGTPTQDANGAVRVNWLGDGDCAGAACKLVLVNKGADLTFTYKVRGDAAYGPRQTGMSMNVYAFIGTQIWNPMTRLNLSVAQPTVATTTTVSVPPAATVGATVPLIAAVSPSDATGSVQFKENGVDIGGPVTVSGGSARLDHVFAAAGTRPISATFTGTGAYVNSNGAARNIVVTVPSPDDKATTTIMTSPSTAVTGTAITLSAQVSGASQYPGTVQFYDNNAPIGGPVSVDTSGVAALSHTFTTVGAHDIVAVYSGGAGVLGSVADPQTVNVTQGDPGTGPWPEVTGSLGSLDLGI
ncbi:Ig-like domain-containing protein [Rhodococcus sp. SGAir0479]|uniref:Ig-like domain-containing protein n=1 Tax=Rhodococcus sp. SGAir0479 TaxID=2567884 RepID=UPI0010CD5634|nr:Ig-like domain-containing protein [Rhodococcus sp. SGAir0479]QCQ93176.1 Ig-like domain repeat protein [Rhodococcus sp. SGAir0479]